MVISADRQKVLRLIEAEGAQVVDVLPPREYDESHIPGAISIPLKQLTRETVSVLSRDKPVVVYCHDGLCDMSPRAACRLEAFGFTQVYDYVEGIADWKAAALPLEGNKDQPPRVTDATRTDVPTCRPDATVGEVRSVVAGEWDVCVVVDCDEVVVGRLRRSALGEGDESRVEELMEPGPGTVRPDSLLGPLVDRLIRRDIPHVLVTTPQGKLLGVLVRDEAKRLLAGDPPEQIWADCDCCPGRWTTAS